jgi:protein-L-isoaspartate(D-aspartate) O-methyltransferase
MAALLAHRGQQVLSFEIVAELAQMAERNLRRAGVVNARIVAGDGSRGAPADGPFDVIALSGAVAELPQSLLAQLKLGGRLAAIVGTPPVMRATLLTRVGPGDSLGEFRRVELFDTLAPPLLGFPEPPRFRF